MLKSHSNTISLSQSLTLTLSLSHSLTLHVLNNFCFHVYAEKSLFIAENCNGFFLTSSTSPYPDTFSLSPSLTLTLSYSHTLALSHFHTLSMSHSITLDMLNKFLFSCLCSKVTVYKLANLQNLQIDPWDMLNKFCFHVYAQKSLFIAENCNAFFWPPPHPILLL